MHVRILLVNIGISVETLLESFFEYLFYCLFFSLYLFIRLVHIVADLSLVVKILKDNLSLMQLGLKSVYRL